MPHLVIVADDLTGAADTAAPFASAGLVVVLALRASGAPEADVLALSTESRDLPQDEATARVRSVVARFHNVSCLYKKIDSTLRGHPGVELITAMDELGTKRALVAPAFPAQHRTTVGGRQLVKGVPLQLASGDGEMAGLNLRNVFGKPAGLSVRLVGLETVRRGAEAICMASSRQRDSILIADAETDADLTTIAQAAVRCGFRLLCGSGGLARALVGVLKITSEAFLPCPPPPRPGPTLIVAGSRNARTLQQVTVARRCGTPTVRLTAYDLTASASNTAAREMTMAHLAEGHNVILTSADVEVPDSCTKQIAIWLGEFVRCTVQETDIGGLVVTGGDVAAAVCASLGVSAIWLRGESEPGIPWGILLDGLRPGLPIVTKAGGFGTDDALLDAIKTLSAI